MSAPGNRPADEAAQAAATFERAHALHRRGELGQAKSLYEAILAAQPRHFDATHLLGVIALQSEDAERAIDLIRQAITIRGDVAAAYVNLAVAQRTLGRAEVALASYDRAIALRPDHVETYLERGNLLFDLRRLDDAMADYDRALALKPEFPEALNNRGNVLCALGRPGDALSCYSEAIALSPNYPDAHLNKGSALLLLKRPGEAVACLERALALRPDRELLPGVLLHARLKAAEWNGIEPVIEACRMGILEGRRMIAPFAAALLFDDPEILHRVARLYADRLMPVAAPIASVRRNDGAERIRVAYYSADFHDHAVAHLIAELFELHDRDAFEFFAFSFGPDRPDGMAERLRASGVGFCEVREKSDREIAMLSRQMGIDIAVDLNGYTEGARPGIFAARCAPIQVGWLGYPGTMGSEAFDYLIADRIAVPPDHQAHFTEKLVYLPDSYQPNDGRRPIADRVFTRGELGLPERGFIFCCFNNSQKILPEMLDRWMRIVKAVDGSLLWLHASDGEAIANLRREAEGRGVAGERLCFAGPMPLPEHLARHRLADLFLDSWPYNAHTTASDALWAGLPVLTCAGRSFAARVAASLLEAVGMPELIAPNERDYEAEAIALATDPAKLARLRAKLERNRPTAPLFDATRFARNIERAYAMIHARRRAGLASDLIDLAETH